MREDAAVEKVVRTLERRWRERLPNGRLPKAMRKVLVKLPHFREYVERVQRTGALPLPDLDFHPEIERRPDGTLVDLLIEELGADPGEFVCVDCEGETPRGQRRCGPCESWRRTGGKTT